MKKIVLIFSFLLLLAQAQAKDSLSLYIFLLDDCIICQSYTPKINTLASTYGDDVTFVGIFPNFSSKPEKITQFKEKYNIQFHTKTDYWKSLTKKFGVEITPEVVLYDEDKNLILYKERIDNEFFSLGKRRRVVTTDELSEVLENISKGERKVFPFTDAVSCFINQNDPTKTK